MTSTEGSTGQQARSPRLYVGIALAIVASCVVAWFMVRVLPGFLYPDLSDASLAGLTPSQRIAALANRDKLQVDAGSTLLQAVAGVAVIAGAWTAWNQFRSDAHASERKEALDKRRLEIDRLSKSMTDLGDDKMIVRVAGVFTLGSIAENSDQDRANVAEVLGVYVREHSDAVTADPPLNTPLNDDELRELRHYRPDVQAAMDVLGRHSFSWYGGDSWRFRYADLRRLSLGRAHFERTRFTEAHLEMTWFTKCCFEGASFRGAHMQRAHLERCDFFGANLRGADLTDVDGLETCTLTEVIWDITTRWPSKFDPDAHGMTKVPIDAPRAGGTTRDGRSIPAV